MLSPAPVEEIPLRLFAERAYLDYALYVISDRALPHIGDGLKPVQRRIVYAMSELGLSATAKPKKSARTVGDVLGKYHPHGDTACYEAMVLMAQAFSYRYPLIDGHGHWGSVDDPKSFAAMRYTEARLSAFSDVLLKEIGQGTVDWSPNFDGTLEEPTLLPARLPHVLINGAMGIAVGMSTDIPPHALSEIGAACLHVLDHPDCTVEDLCVHVLAPDYPGGAEIITPREELCKMYQNGTGSLRLRARYAADQDTIVIDALPHQVASARVLEQIVQQMRDKKLPMVEDLRDESDHENPTRIVLALRPQRVDAHEIMAHLFATTDLEKSYRIHLNMIGIDGRPQVKNLRHILTEWLAFRIETVQRRIAYRLAAVEQRLHLIEGFLCAHQQLDQVIALLRDSDHPKAGLATQLGLSEQQATAVLEMKLRQLARLEGHKLQEEQRLLQEEQARCQVYLSTPTQLKGLIRAEIVEDVQRYGDGRRCPLVARQAAQALDDAILSPSEPMVVILSKKGWVRAAKGRVDAVALSYKAGDAFLDEAQGRSHQWAAFLDNTGRSYALPIAGLASARGYGEPLTGKLNPPNGAAFLHVLAGEPQDVYLLATEAGYGFICPFGELLSRNKSGKQVVILPEAVRLLPPIRIENAATEQIIAISDSGRLLCFPVSELPQLAKGKGNRIMDVASTEAAPDHLAFIRCVLPGHSIILTAGQRTLTLKSTDIAHYASARGRKGRPLPRGFRRVEGITLIDH